MASLLVAVRQKMDGSKAAVTGVGVRGWLENGEALDACRFLSYDR
jgi:hypothetical protein